MIQVLRNKFVLFALLVGILLLLLTVSLILFSQNSENKPFIYQVY